MEFQKFKLGMAISDHFDSLRFNNHKMETFSSMQHHLFWRDNLKEGKEWKQKGELINGFNNI